MPAASHRPSTGPPTTPDDDTCSAGPDEPPGATPARHTSTARSLLRLWPYVRPVRVRLSSAAVVAVLASCLGLVIPLVLKWMVDGPVQHRDPGGAWLGGGMLLVLGVAEAALFGLRRWLVARPLASVEASMRADLYRHLQRLPVSFHDRWSSGQLLSRGTTDLMLLRQFLAFPLTFLLVNGVTILVGFGILLSQNLTLGLLLSCPAVPMVILCWIFESRYAAAARTVQDQTGDLTTIVEEGVLGIRIIKGFGRHRAQARAFRGLAELLRTTELHKARLLAALLGLITLLPELAIGVALALGTVRVAHGSLSAGTLVAFLSTALTLRWPVESIGFLLAMCQESATATDRFFEVMAVAEESEADARPVPAEGPTAEPAAGPVAGDDPTAADGRTDGIRRNTAATGTEGGLRFEGVRFRYPDAPDDAPWVLDGVDLHVRPGETVALVGGTGCGKTTLTALVPRLYDATCGRITIDGRDITALPREELRSLVAVAFEETTLFSMSAGANVLLGASDAGQADLDRALEIAQAGFVHALPQGQDTPVGEQGLNLSGGQRQRLALARAVVDRPRFLILDDPLSALDVETEALVEAALRQVLATTTALVVAHRPSTVLLADRVALLADGRITAVGTHHELLRSRPDYRSLMSGEAASEYPPGGGTPTGRASGDEPADGGAPSDAHSPAAPAEVHDAALDPALHPAPDAASGEKGTPRPARDGGQEGTDERMDAAR